MCTKDPPGATASSDRHADLRRPSAAQRRRQDSRANDGRRLAHASGDQRRGYDPRLGIRLARRLHRIGRAKRGDRHVRNLARDGFVHPSCTLDRRSRRPGLRASTRPIHSRRWREPPGGRCSGRPDRRRTAASADRRPRRPAQGDGRARLDCRANRASTIAGSTPRSSPRPFATASRSPSTPASATTSSPTTRFFAARPSAVRANGISSSSAARCATSMAASCSRSARLSWGRRSLKKPSLRQ